jgi:hypothetical protein
MPVKQVQGPEIQTLVLPKNLMINHTIIVSKALVLIALR